MHRELGTAVAGGIFVAGRLWATMSVWSCIRPSSPVDWNRLQARAWRTECTRPREVAGHQLKPHLADDGQSVADWSPVVANAVGSPDGAPLSGDRTPISSGAFVGLWPFIDDTPPTTPTTQPLDRLWELEKKGLQSSDPLKLQASWSLLSWRSWDSVLKHRDV